MSLVRKFSDWNLVAVKRLKVYRRNNLRHLERFWGQANETAVWLLQKTSRWTPSALNLRKRGHHPVCSTMTLKRKVNDQTFSQIKAKVVLARMQYGASISPNDSNTSGLLRSRQPLTRKTVLEQPQQLLDKSVSFTHIGGGQKPVSKMRL